MTSSRMGVIRVGFFQNFKGRDTILIDVDRETLGPLIGIFTRLAAGAAALDITAEQDVVSYRGVVLVAESSAANRLTAPRPRQFKWTATAEFWADTESKVAAIQDKTNGHQYLYDQGAVQIIASVGEYGPEWWSRYAGVDR